MSVLTSVRNATLQDLAGLLQDQHAAKVDVVAPATALRAEDGLIRVRNAEAQITPDGVTQVDGLYRPTGVFDEGVADKLKIPVAYVRRLRAERPDLYDANVNGWLHGNPAAGVDFDSRSFLFRGYTGGGGGEGVARALLSDKYARIDNFDVLTATLAGVKQAGVDVVVDGCDLTDRRMYVRVLAPQVRALAPILLRGYRSPFGSPDVQRANERGWEVPDDGSDDPVVFAGFVFSNSEVGAGAFTITPRLTVKVCRNGMTVNKDAMRAVHLGAQLEEGIVRWSAETQRKALELVTAKAADAVATFLDTDYIRGVIEQVEEQAEVSLGKPAETVEQVGKALAFDQQTITGVLDHFIRGGQMTAGGVLAAVTSFAQTVPDGDRAHELESAGLRALELAARAA